MTTPSLYRVGAAALVLALSGALSIAMAGQIRSAGEDRALQVIADVVLIESQCRALNVNYGKLFAFAEMNGIRPVEILPTGLRRAAFEAATRRRLKETRVDELCSDLAAEREAAVPGVFTAR